MPLNIEKGIPVPPMPITDVQGQELVSAMHVMEVNDSVRIPFDPKPFVMGAKSALPTRSFTYRKIIGELVPAYRVWRTK